MPILVDSDEEGTKSKVKRVKQEAAPAIKVEGNGSAFKGDTVDLLSDSEEEAGAALQPEAALVQDDADPPAPPAEPEGCPARPTTLAGHAAGWPQNVGAAHHAVDESRSPHRLGH